jgi:DNA primase
MISRDTIENIVTSARIEEVVGEFVTLRRRGANLLGLCPFHNEKTPSFTVSPVKGIYKCFGCGKAGNSVNFIMEHEHFTYPEALRYLAKKYNIEIEEEVVSPEVQLEQNEKEALFNVNLFAQQYFTHILFETEEGKAVGLTYFKEREIREDIIRKFQLGFSPDPWDAFTQHAIKNGYKKEYLEKSGLTLSKDGRLYDRFHSRVIFPIHSASGRIIGFGGRILTSEKNRPKYVNSPESEIYNKSKSLYGLFLARHSISSKDNCFLVEGYTDVISLHQAGIENVVASSGTSLTHDQIRMIERYTKNITILYDGDSAGIKASLRGIDMIIEAGMNVKIVLFPDGEDPDSYARKHHPSEVEDFIAKNSANFILFKTRLLLEETKDDPIRKSALIKEIVHTISLIPDGITRTLYVRECANLMGITELVLVNEINKLLRNKYSKSAAEGEKPAVEALLQQPIPTPQQAEYDPDTAEFQEREIIRLLLLFGGENISFEVLNAENQPETVSFTIAEYVVRDILNDDLGFDHPQLAQIFNEFAAGTEKEEAPSRAYFLSHPVKELATLAIDLVFTPYELSENWEKNHILIHSEDKRIRETILEALHAFKSKKIDRMMTVIQKKIQLKPPDNEVDALLKELLELKKKSMQINDFLGRIITR